MSLARRSPWLPLAAAAAVAATLLVFLTARPGDQAPRHRPPPTGPAAAPLASPVLPRVCVTRYGLCPIGPVQAGSPCGCPHPLHGSVPGHVEPVGDAPASAGSLYWPSREAEEEDDPEDPLARLGPLHGP
jgi:hypothetical protein